MRTYSIDSEVVLFANTLSAVDEFVETTNILASFGCSVVEHSDCACCTCAIHSEEALVTRAFNTVPSFISCAVHGALTVDSHKWGFTLAFTSRPPFVFRAHKAAFTAVKSNVRTGADASI